MLVGYARVSTTDQRLDLQADALKAAGVDPSNVRRQAPVGRGSKASGRVKPIADDGDKAARDQTLDMASRVDRL